MNPTYIDRKSLIEKFNFGLKKLHQKNIKEKKDEDREKKPERTEKSKQKIIIKPISSKIKALLPPLYSKNMSEVNKSNDHIKYVYKINNIIETNIINLKSNKLIHLCIFTIVENIKSIPFLLYLLNKDLKTNTLYFPHFYTNDNIYKKAKEYINTIFSLWTDQPIMKGYIETANNIYIFYEQTYNYNLEKMESKEIWWWSSIYEIINIKTILNYVIDNSVYKIFYANPELIVLFDSNDNKLEIPIIGYYGAYYTYISFIAAFGLPKQLPDSNLGPYYYFYTYYGAGRGAIWTSDRKPKFVDGKKITVNEYGIHDRGGIVRFAIFGNKIKYFLNKDTDIEDKSSMSVELAKKVPFIKSTLKIRDVDGQWVDHHDLAYIGSVLIKSEKYNDRILIIQFAARDFNQQIPLSYHYVNTKEFSKISDIEQQKKMPYEYKDYDIE